MDLTGGAPELHPQFRWLVTAARALGVTVIDRCNLTILEPGQEDLARFLADEGVRVVASLPCYEQERVDLQRGQGVYERSIAGLKLLYQLGYGQAGSSLELDLVFNPLGAALPPPQASLRSSTERPCGRPMASASPIAHDHQHADPALCARISNIRVPWRAMTTLKEAHRPDSLGK